MKLKTTVSSKHHNDGSDDEEAVDKNNSQCIQKRKLRMKYRNDENLKINPNRRSWRPLPCRSICQEGQDWPFSDRSHDNMAECFLPTPGGVKKEGGGTKQLLKTSQTSLTSLKRHFSTLTLRDKQSFRLHLSLWLPRIFQRPTLRELQEALTQMKTNVLTRLCRIQLVNFNQELSESKAQRHLFRKELLAGLVTKTWPFYFSSVVPDCQKSLSSSPVGRAVDSVVCQPEASSKRLKSNKLKSGWMEGQRNWRHSLMRSDCEDSTSIRARPVPDCQKDDSKTGSLKAVPHLPDWLQSLCHKECIINLDPERDGEGQGAWEHVQLPRRLIIAGLPNCDHHILVTEQEYKAETYISQLPSLHQVTAQAKSPCIFKKKYEKVSANTVTEVEDLDCSTSMTSGSMTLCPKERNLSFIYNWKPLLRRKQRSTLRERIKQICKLPTGNTCKVDPHLAHVFQSKTTNKYSTLTREMTPKPRAQKLEKEGPPIGNKLTFYRKNCAANAKLESYRLGIRRSLTCTEDVLADPNMKDDLHSCAAQSALRHFPNCDHLTKDRNMSAAKTPVPGKTKKSLRFSKMSGRNRSNSSLHGANGVLECYQDVIVDDVTQCTAVSRSKSPARLQIEGNVTSRQQLVQEFQVFKVRNSDSPCKRKDKGFLQCSKGSDTVATEGQFQASDSLPGNTTNCSGVSSAQVVGGRRNIASRVITLSVESARRQKEKDYICNRRRRMSESKKQSVAEFVKEKWSSNCESEPLCHVSNRARAVPRTVCSATDHYPTNRQTRPRIDHGKVSPRKTPSSPQGQACARPKKESELKVESQASCEFMCAQRRENYQELCRKVELYYKSLSPVTSEEQFKEIVIISDKEPNLKNSELLTSTANVSYGRFQKYPTGDFQIPRKACKSQSALQQEKATKAKPLPDNAPTFGGLSFSRQEMNMLSGHVSGCSLRSELESILAVLDQLCSLYITRRFKMPATSRSKTPELADLNDVNGDCGKYHSGYLLMRNSSGAHLQDTANRSLQNSKIADAHNTSVNNIGDSPPPPASPKAPLEIGAQNETLRISQEYLWKDKLPRSLNEPQQRQPLNHLSKKVSDDSRNISDTFLLNNEAVPEPSTYPQTFVPDTALTTPRGNSLVSMVPATESAYVSPALMPFTISADCQQQDKTLTSIKSQSVQTSFMQIPRLSLSAQTPNVFLGRDAAVNFPSRQSLSIQTSPVNSAFNAPCKYGTSHNRGHNALTSSPCLQKSRAFIPRDNPLSYTDCNVGDKLQYDMNMQQKLSQQSRQNSSEECQWRSSVQELLQQLSRKLDLNLEKDTKPQTGNHLEPSRKDQAQLVADYSPCSGDENVVTCLRQRESRKLYQNLPPKFQTWDKKANEQVQCKSQEDGSWNLRHRACRCAAADEKSESLFPNDRSPAQQRFYDLCQQLEVPRQDKLNETQKKEAAFLDQITRTQMQTLAIVNQLCQNYQLLQGPFQNCSHYSGRHFKRDEQLNPCHLDLLLKGFNDSPAAASHAPYAYKKVDEYSAHSTPGPRAMPEARYDNFIHQKTCDPEHDYPSQARDFASFSCRGDDALVVNYLRPAQRPVAEEGFSVPEQCRPRMFTKSCQAAMPRPVDCARSSQYRKTMTRNVISAHVQTCQCISQSNGPCKCGCVQASTTDTKKAKECPVQMEQVQAEAKICCKSAQTAFESAPLKSAYRNKKCQTGKYLSSDSPGASAQSDSTCDSSSMAEDKPKCATCKCHVDSNFDYCKRQLWRATHENGKQTCSIQKHVQTENSCSCRPDGKTEEEVGKIASNEQNKGCLKRTHFCEDSNTEGKTCDNTGRPILHIRYRSKQVGGAPQKALTCSGAKIPSINLKSQIYEIIEKSKVLQQQAVQLGKQCQSTSVADNCLICHLEGDEDPDCILTANNLQNRNTNANCQLQSCRDREHETQDDKGLSRERDDTKHRMNAARFLQNQPIKDQLGKEEISSNFDKFLAKSMKDKSLPEIEQRKLSQYTTPSRQNICWADKSGPSLKTTNHQKHGLFLSDPMCHDTPHVFNPTETGSIHRVIEREEEVEACTDVNWDKASVHNVQWDGTASQCFGPVEQVKDLCNQYYHLSQSLDNHKWRSEKKTEFLTSLELLPLKLRTPCPSREYWNLAALIGSPNALTIRHRTQVCPKSTQTTNQLLASIIEDPSHVSSCVEPARGVRHVGTSASFTGQWLHRNAAIIEDLSPSESEQFKPSDDQHWTKCQAKVAGICAETSSGVQDKEGGRSPGLIQIKSRDVSHSGTTRVNPAEERALKRPFQTNPSISLVPGQRDSLHIDKLDGAIHRKQSHVTDGKSSLSSCSELLGFENSEASSRGIEELPFDSNNQEHSCQVRSVTSSADSVASQNGVLVTRPLAQRSICFKSVAENLSRSPIATSSKLKSEALPGGSCTVTRRHLGLMRRLVHCWNSYKTEATGTQRAADLHCELIRPPVTSEDCLPKRQLDSRQPRERRTDAWCTCFVTCAEVTEVDSGRAVIEGAYMRKEPVLARSRTSLEPDTQRPARCQVLPFKLLIIRDVEEKEMRGTYVRQLLTSKQTFAWKFRVDS